MAEETKKKTLLQKGGRFGAIIGAAWIGINIIVPLIILRIPAVQKYLASLEGKLPFDITVIG